MASRRGRRRPPRFESRALLLALLVGLLPLAIAVGLLLAGDREPRTVWTLGAIVVLWWLFAALHLREAVVRPIQTISNLLAALREGDFSVRGRGARDDDALGLALLEVNALGDTLRDQRLRVFEATALLRRVMEEVDVAVFAFDAEDSLRLVNRAGERLLAQPAERLLGGSAEALGLARCLRDDCAGGLEQAFPGASGRWEVRRSEFRRHGRPMRLLVLADVSRTLRQEERQAWQRLVRVLSHEINNSLAPISSIVANLRTGASRSQRPDDWEDDLKRGLAVVAGRADALVRFMAAYARLARLPSPRPGPVDVGAWVKRVARLETRREVRVDPGPAVTVQADGDQLDQVLINLVANAVEATAESGGEVAVRWELVNGSLEVRVIDGGPGITESANLFVPFYTTKPGGSGIGLALSRQIVEAHGGSLTVRNRSDARGCEARLVLPVEPRQPSAVSRQAGAL